MEVRTGLNGFADDGRWVEVDLPCSEHGVLTVISTYVHTGQAGTTRQAEKYRFMDAMARRLEELAGRSSAGAGEALVTGRDPRNGVADLVAAGSHPALHKS